MPAKNLIAAANRESDFQNRHGLQPAGELPAFSCQTRKNRAIQSQGQ